MFPNNYMDTSFSIHDLYITIAWLEKVGLNTYQLTSCKQGSHFFSQVTVHKDFLFIGLLCKYLNNIEVIEFLKDTCLQSVIAV